MGNDDGNTELKSKDIQVNLDIVREGQGPIDMQVKCEIFAQFSK